MGGEEGGEWWGELQNCNQLIQMCKWRWFVHHINANDGVSTEGRDERMLALLVALIEAAATGLAGLECTHYMCTRVDH